MKILKIFGIVVGIHVFALILIFANPGCSSAAKSSPSPGDTVVSPPPASNSAEVSPVIVAPLDSPVSSAPASFDPNAPATSAVRFSPTRPGTPVAATLEAQPVADVTPASTYTVAKGDSLWTIAKKNHLTVGELAAANNIKAGATVRIGQKLIIPGKSAPSETVHAAAAPAAKPAVASPAPVSAPKTAGEPMRYTVKPGETLGAIARKYQVKVGDIATANNISDPAKIRPGMELIIPTSSSAGGKSTKAAAAKPAASSPTEQAAVVPTIGIPSSEQDAGSAAQAKSGEPPVIKVEDTPEPGKQ